MNPFKFIKSLFSKSASSPNPTKTVEIPPILLAHVSNRGCPPVEFVRELIAWAKYAPEEIFAPNSAQNDVYMSVRGVLGPWRSDNHRRAVMCEILLVLGGFESWWDWNCGRDTTNATSVTPTTIEAGIFQVSANSMNFGYELRSLVIQRVGSDDPNLFQEAMKQDHTLALEYAARLLRRTVNHNGPVKRHEIDPFLSKSAVSAFEKLL